MSAARAGWASTVCTSTLAWVVAGESTLAWVLAGESALTMFVAGEESGG